MLSPLYGQLSPLRVPTKAVREVKDSDALAYIAAVETADAQTLEDSVKYAYEDFILGCKADGIWTAIKASCILAGARTLTGALIPLVGSSPINNNFVSSDYERATGLLGNGSTKTLNTNVAGNSADVPQDNVHFSVWATEEPTASATGAYGGNAGAGSTGIVIFRGGGGSTSLASNANGISRQITTHSTWDGFKGTNRSSSSQFNTRSGGSNFTYSVASTTRLSANIAVFSRSVAVSIPSNGRYSFYSLGESLDLALLDTRVSTLMTALAAAIP
jgi:hypothetical protein